VKIPLAVDARIRHQAGSMKATLLSVVAFAFTSSLACHGAEVDAEGFTPIFDGKTLAGFTKVGGDGEFRVEDGQIVGHGANVKANTFLRTDKTFKDFDFRFQMKFDDLTGNSGMMFRGLQKDGNGRVFGYQCEHDNGKDRAWTAGLYDEARRGWLSPDKKNPKDSAEFTKKIQGLMKWADWNDIRIVAKGKKIEIFLNGTQVVDYTDDGKEFTPEGFFGMQVHAGPSCNARWRSLRIKEL
jgi:hypothetical protein